MIDVGFAFALLAPPSVEAPPTLVDRQQTEQGVVTRLGTRGDDWTIGVVITSGTRAIATLHAPDGATLQREITLDGPDIEARSRQLATSVAIVIDNYDPPPALIATETQTSAPEEPTGESLPTGWLAAGAHLSTGPVGRAAVAGGVTLAGGIGLARDHVQPMLTIGWRRSSADVLVVDGANIDGAVLVGLPLLRGQLWFGGGLGIGALGGYARDSVRASGWSAHLTVPIAVQLRLQRLFAEAYTGAEVGLPPLRFVGDATTLRWGQLRAMFGLRVGLRFGGRRSLD